MADTVKILTILLMISLMLYIGDTFKGHAKPFGEDILDEWISKDSSGNPTGPSSTIQNAKDSYFNPSSASSNAGIDTDSFWDRLQIGWKFLALIFNVVFNIPYQLIALEVPYMIKIVVILPLIVVSIAVFIVRGLMGNG